MKTVKIAGAGFSGLTLAYQLLRQGMQVEIYEKQLYPGGLIKSMHLENGLVETAANAFLADQSIEELFNDFNRSRFTIYKFNFMRGIFFGLGSVLGGTVVLALVVWVLNGLGVLVPGLGGFLHDVVQVMGKTQK